MNRIEIRGVIVPSNYDLEWTRQYIEKGIISPESHVRKQIAAADKKAPLALYVNSPGGSVFAAYEIINSINQWRMDNGQPAQLVIGAMAASAAAAISILSGAEIRVHRNSKLMFHGAWTETLGGADAHADTVTLLNQINADLKTALVSKYGVPVDVVDEWFAEGRMGWLTAQDAVKYNMAKEIVDEDDAEVEFLSADVAGIEANGLKIAAFASLPPVAEVPAVEPKQEEQPHDGGTTDTQPIPVASAEPCEPAPAGEPAARPAAEQTSGPSDEDRISAEVNHRVEAEFSERLAKHMTLIAELKAKCDEIEKARKATQSAKDKADAEHAKQIKHFEERLAEKQVALERANARLVKLTLGSLTYSPAIESWSEALAACGGDYAQARKQYPDAYQQFMNQTNKGNR